jgi:hypothetical protein
MPEPLPKGKGKIQKTLHEFKEGTLKSGSGHPVTNRKQAIAIALEQQRDVEARAKRHSRGGR